MKGRDQLKSSVSYKLLNFAHLLLAVIKCHFVVDYCSGVSYSVINMG